MTVSSVKKLLGAGFALLVAIGALGSAPAWAQAASPGAGFANPDGVARRSTRPDVETVFRGPVADTLATIRKRGVLRVGVAVSAPTVMYDAQGALVGFSIDAARRLAEDLGVQVEFVPSSWSGIVADLLNRESDVILSGLWVTVPRALVINFSAPTAVEGIHVIASRAAAGSMRSVDDLNRAGVRIAVYAGTLQERLAARRFPNATLVRVEGNRDHLAPVLSGEVQAALVPTFAPQVIVGAAPDKLALPFPQPLSTAAIAMGVRKGDPDFLNFLDSWLTVQRDEGWIEERTRYWAQPANWVK